jgi:hypothetical protein
MNEQHDSNRSSFSNKGQHILIPHILLSSEAGNSKPQFHHLLHFMSWSRGGLRTGLSRVYQCKISLPVIMLRLEITLSHRFIGSYLTVPEIQYALRERGYKCSLNNRSCWDPKWLDSIVALKTSSQTPDNHLNEFSHDDSSSLTKIEGFIEGSISIMMRR